MSASEERYKCSFVFITLPIFRCGKTTLARILPGFADALFKEVSASISTVNEVCSIFGEARDKLQSTGRCVTKRGSIDVL